MQAGNEFVVLLIIHDCLKILKVWSRANPLEAVYLGIDNLYLSNGKVCLCDPFLNRTKLLQELIKLKTAKDDAGDESGLPSVRTSSQTHSAEKQKLWQV